MKDRLGTLQGFWRAVLAAVLLALAGGAGAQRLSLEGLQAQINAKIALSDLAACAANDTVVKVAGVWRCKSTLPRFVDNGDGTISDNKTGLMWEKKNACSSGGTDIHCVGNLYQSTSSGNLPNGDAYTVFLNALNGVNALSSPPSVGPCFANYCDWRLPTLAELRSILLATSNCGNLACVDPLFHAVAYEFEFQSCGVFQTSTPYQPNNGYVWTLSLCTARAGTTVSAYRRPVIAVRGSSL